MVYNGLDSFDDSHVGGCVRISNRRPFWNTAFCDKELKPLCFKGKDKKNGSCEASYNNVTIGAI